MEAKLLSLEQQLQPVNELASEYFAEDADWKEERSGRANPSGMIWCETAGGDNAVKMWMVLQVLSPCVQHGEKADLGAEILPVSAATSMSVSAVARNRRSYTSFLFCKASPERSCGSVKTTWK